MDKVKDPAMQKRETVKAYVLMHMLLLLFSVSSICSKLAGQSAFLSWRFCLFYGLVLVIMAVYALLWQQILKRVPLVTAYANKAVTVIWGLIWGYVIFKEQITLLKVIGAIVVIIGVYLVVSGDDEVIASKKKSEEEVKENA